MHGKPRVVFLRPKTEAAAKVYRYNPYAILGVWSDDPRSLLDQSSADYEKRMARVRDAYTDLLVLYHPDKSLCGLDSLHAFNVSFGSHREAVTESYDILMDPIKTLQYLRAETNDWAEFSPAERKSLNALETKLRRSRALRQQQDMAEVEMDFVNRQLERQASGKDSLFVTLALFGDRTAIEVLAAKHPLIEVGHAPLQADRVLDVTTPIARRVIVGDPVPEKGFPHGRAELRLSSDPKTEWDGFYDPCEPFEPHLLVRYRYCGRERQVVVDNSTPLSCPMKAHDLVPEPPPARAPAAVAPLRAAAPTRASVRGQGAAAPAAIAATPAKIKRDKSMRTPLRPTQKQTEAAADKLEAELKLKRAEMVDTGARGGAVMGAGTTDGGKAPLAPGETVRRKASPAKQPRGNTGAQPAASRLALAPDSEDSASSRTGAAGHATPRAVPASSSSSSLTLVWTAAALGGAVVAAGAVAVAVLAAKRMGKI